MIYKLLGHQPSPKLCVMAMLPCFVLDLVSSIYPTYLGYKYDILLHTTISLDSFSLPK